MCECGPLLALWGLHHETHLAVVFDMGDHLFSLRFILIALNPNIDFLVCLYVDVGVPSKSGTSSSIPNMLLIPYWMLFLAPLSSGI